jgi:hypothetical protein
MASLRELEQLESLVDAAMQLAVELDQSTTAYILSIARLDISKTLEQLIESPPDESDDL